MAVQLETPIEQPASPSTDDDQAVVRVERLSKQFRRAGGAIVPAVDDVSLVVRPGEFIVLLGPSGCGKTTLLRSIAGLERPDAGHVEVHDKLVFDSARGVNMPPERRRISMIFQSYALWPHMSAFDNVAYPLRSRKVRKAETASRVQHVLDLVGIGELAKQYPSQLSGGQQQRVALARAIVANDDLVLFDEPLSNVDAKVREQLRLELMSMQREIGFSALYVTHDQVEAMELATRIAVMRSGKIAQLGTPREVYECPSSRYVARFIGTANELPGRVRAAGGQYELDTALGTVHAASVADGVSDGDDAVLVFRPERCVMSVDEPTAPNRWRGTVETALFVGSHCEHIVRLGDDRFRVWQGSSELTPEGSEVWVAVEPDDVRAVFADEPGASTENAPGPAER